MVYRVPDYNNPNGALGLWNDCSNDISFFNPTEIIGFICEWDNTSNTQTTIPSDAVNYNGHAYKIFDTSMTWYDAKSYCESLGGHLVTITSQEEQDFIVNLISSYGHKNYYWLGATDELEEGNWLWITGEPWVYTAWCPGQPDNFPQMEDTENYLSISRKYDLLWNDLPVNGASQDVSEIPTESGFICEWDTDKNTQSSLKTSTDDTTNGNYISNEQWDLSISGNNSVTIYKLTDTTYRTETSDIGATITNKQFNYNINAPKYSDAEKENLTIKNVKLWITVPEDVTIDLDANDYPIGVVTNDTGPNTTIFYELGDIGYDYSGTKYVKLGFTYNPDKDVNPFDIKVRVTADNDDVDDLNTTYRVTYRRNYGIEETLIPNSLLKRSTINNDLSNAAEAWIRASENYTNLLQIRAQEEKKNEEKKSVNKDKENQLIDNNINNLKNKITFVPLDNMFLNKGTRKYAEVENYCYKFLFQYLIDASDDKLKLSDIDTSQKEIKVSHNIIQSIVDSLYSDEKNYSTDTYEIKITVDAYISRKEAFMGKIICTDKQSNIDYVMRFTSSYSTTISVMNYFIDDLAKLQINTVESLLQTIISEASSAIGFTDYLNSKLHTILKNNKQLLIDKGFGDLDVILGKCDEYYNPQLA